MKRILPPAFARSYGVAGPRRAVALSVGGLVSLLLAAISGYSSDSRFDAAPFGLPLPASPPAPSPSHGEGVGGEAGVVWEDPREIHQVIVHFSGAPPRSEKVRLEYWGSRWPEQHLPKDRQPGGADVGWMELGNWYNGGWRVADAEARTEGSTLFFTFRAVNAKEFPALKDYGAAFRYTLKIRLASDQALPKVERIEAFTDSTWKEDSARLEWAQAPGEPIKVQAFNGRVESVQNISPAHARMCGIRLLVASNPDPNTFDRTLATVRQGKDAFTFAMDDLNQGPLFLPHLGVAILPEHDKRDYAAIAADQKARGAKTLYDRVAERPEQTWRAAWAGLPRKKSDIYFPLGLDGGRQRFRLEPDGSVRFRSSDRFIQRQPGKDTPRLALEPPDARFQFGPLLRPAFRTIEEESLPICHTTWETNGLRILHTAFATELEGAKPNGPVPPADAFTVFLARFVFTNISQTPQIATLPLQYKVGETTKPLRVSESGLLWSAENLRGQVLADKPPASRALSPALSHRMGEGEGEGWTWTLAPGESKTEIVKIPYVALTEQSERQALEHLDFEKERTAVAGYWRRRLDQSARLTTPESMLNEFYRAHAGHLLINCEREPDHTLRFARVGSFSYGAYGNESCMMVVDLDRRGYHQEAQECLDSWLRYQGTVGLPGDFSSQDGVLYGAGGYEDGGYNQHHGWILWCLVEHFRFTRDEAWLRRAIPGMLAAANWIIRETKRSANRHELERGLLPAGSLEDIGDWWTWLSTSCYTWRGLDSAAWALEQTKHPEARRIRKEAG